MTSLSKKTNAPLNKKLYEKVKSEAKKRFNSWPSAYGSGWLVREYKKRGGKYSSEKKPRKTTGLQRWFELEEWINVCYLPRIVKCGRPGSVDKSSYWKKFPYCRPLKKASPKTPKTVKELSKKELKRRCSQKRKSPKTKLVKKTIKKTIRKTRKRS
jgi:hypothetical protein